jgi:pantetheine-phosphate adenylyltransferase
MRVGLYPGSFDPVTYGHVDIVRRARHFVDRLVIAIGTHHAKEPLFSVDERVTLARAAVEPVAKEIGLSFDVTIYDGLTVDAAREAGASIIVRGLRDAGDFDHEMQMAGMNQALGLLAKLTAHRREPRPPDCRNGRRRCGFRAARRHRGTQEEILGLTPRSILPKEVSCE